MCVCSNSNTCKKTAFKKLEKKQQNIEQSIGYQISKETGQEARGMQRLSHQSDPENDHLLQVKGKNKHTTFGFGKIEIEQNNFPPITILVFLQTTFMFNFDCLTICLCEVIARDRKHKTNSKFFYFVQISRHLIFSETKECFRNTSTKPLKRLSWNQLKLKSGIPMRTESTNNLLWFQQLSE